MVVFRKNKKRIFVASFLTIVSLCFLGAGFLLDNRFPNTDLSIEEINAHGDPMANTRQVFQSGGAARSVPFRILFYGQSITEGAWPSQVVDIWRARYPHLAIVSENRAIGGFASPRLRRTIEADVADLSPDLVVFHVYGSHPEYEETIEILNRMTSADVILQTDHAKAWPAPRCEMGVTFFPSKSPGCTGFPFRQQIGWSEYMSYHFVPTVALRYGFAVEPRLQRWTEQLQRRGLEPSDMLKDMVHLNEDGERMMAELFDAFVEKLVHERKTPSKGRRIRMNVPAPETDGSITLTVPEAYRIEAVGNTLLPPNGLVEVSQQPVETLDECYMHGRPSRLNKDLVWPGIMQVGASAPLVEETWTVVITNITEDAESFSYEVFGSITGYDGAGSSDQDFTSSSQRVVLRAQDWMLAEARKAFDMSFSAPLEIFWRARYLCDDTVEVASAHGTKYIRTLATGLGAGPHFIRLTMGADNLAAIDYFLITRSRAF